MARTTCFVAIVLLAGGAACEAQRRPRGPEITDPAVAKADPDFAVQGEYLGQAVLADGSVRKTGAQVIARGEKQFEIYVLENGLPGDDWQRGDGRIRMRGRREGKVTAVEGDEFSGRIAEGKMTLTRGDGREKIELCRIERKSPTLGAKPPQGAVVLFDGTGVEHFVDAAMSEDGNLMAGTVTKGKFGSYKLHLEFRLSWKPWATGQARSNSGVYVHDCYEIQVLDSFGLEGRDNECGGIYKIKAPDVNMCLPPLVWQTYDIDFTAPEYDSAGRKVSNARLTVCHNGEPIHEDLELPRDTPGRQGEGPAPRPIHLQGHGNKVQYRNIWLEEKQ